MPNPYQIFLCSFLPAPLSLSCFSLPSACPPACPLLLPSSVWGRPAREPSPGTSAGRVRWALGVLSSRLGICRLSSAACEGVCSVLQVNRHLRELDLSFNDLGDAGMWPLCEGLRHPTCRLQKLWLDSCGLTTKACEDLSSALGVSQTLTELYLTHNALGNAGVRLLCKGLSHPGSKLRVLWLFGMDLNKMTHRRLAALRLTKPHLDIGC
nr:NACHT, LRR and PYD domains-containing protein 12-like [Mirounga angustirostris]